jgi:hypothetical protein
MRRRDAQKKSFIHGDGRMRWISFHCESGDRHGQFRLGRDKR